VFRDVFIRLGRYDMGRLLYLSPPPPNRLRTLFTAPSTGDSLMSSLAGICTPKRIASLISHAPLVGHARIRQLVRPAIIAILEKFFQGKQQVFQVY
jgi:hypothetical protein